MAAAPAHATTYTLDDPASPFSAVFDSSGGKLTVTLKADGFIWKNPDSGGGSTLTSGTVTQSDAQDLSASATSGVASFTIALVLTPATSELSVTLGNNSANFAAGMGWPFPFLPSDGSGSAVFPIDSGYVVPTSVTTFTAPQGQRGMEWFGGTDANNSRAWLAIVDTLDDYEIKVRNASKLGSLTLVGAGLNWRGSNNNSTHTTQLLSYSRSLRFLFLGSGGYAAMAKQFRQDAATRGLITTFTAKQQANPALNLDQLIGAPVCYLWGDGRSTALLDAMKNAGIGKALIQVSVNHVDQQKNFPATNLANNSWFDAVRARGYLVGFYDIYEGVRSGGTGGSAYDDFYYLWPGTAFAQWPYFDVNQNPAGNMIQHSTSTQMAASFASSTRIPAHISRFNLDAYFF